MAEQNSFIQNVNEVANFIRENDLQTVSQDITDLKSREEFTNTEKTKLSNIQDDATKNSTDAELRDRSKHTGTQSLDTITETPNKKIMTDIERQQLQSLDGHNHDLRYYNRNTIDELIGEKSDLGHSHDSRYYTEQEINNLLSNYATILNTYSKSEITNFLALKESSNMKGVAGGYAPLDSNGLIPSSMMNSLSTVEVFEASSEANMLLLSSVGVGDQCVRSDLTTNNVYILKQTPSSDINNWIRLSFSATVASVNGMAGVVILTKNDIGLGNVHNIAPLDMPLSNANIVALSQKSNIDHTHTTFSEEQEAILNQKANQSEVDSLSLAIRQTYILNLIGA